MILEQELCSSCKGVRVSARLVFFICFRLSKCCIENVGWNIAYPSYFGGDFSLNGIAPPCHVTGLANKKNSHQPQRTVTTD